MCIEARCADRRTASSEMMRDALGPSIPHRQDNALPPPALHA
jgi:hypothetical protein